MYWTAPKRPERKLANTLCSIAATLDLETWDDLPQGDSAALLAAVDKRLHDLSLAAFLRGVKARDAAEGSKAEELPGGVREAVTRALEAIIRDTETVGYDSGIPHVAEIAREALRVLDGAVLQAGELLTREKIWKSISLGLLRAGIDSNSTAVGTITNEVCELLSSGGARASAPNWSEKVTPSEFADRMNSLTTEEIMQAMERLPTDALEFAVKFECAAHRVPLQSGVPEDDFEGCEPDFDDEDGTCPYCHASVCDGCEEDCPSWDEDED